MFPLIKSDALNPSIYANFVKNVDLPNHFSLQSAIKNATCALWIVFAAAPTRANEEKQRSDDVQNCIRFGCGAIRCDAISYMQKCTRHQRGTSCWILICLLWRNSFRTLSIGIPQEVLNRTDDRTKPRRL